MQFRNLQATVPDHIGFTLGGLGLAGEAGGAVGSWRMGWESLVVVVVGFAVCLRGVGWFHGVWGYRGGLGTRVGFKGVGRWAWVGSGVVGWV